MKARDINPGDRYGRLVIVAEAERSLSGKRRWLCRCGCGKTTTVAQCNLLSENTTSCGCYRTEKTVLRSTKHGAWQSPEYDVWVNMKMRCLSPKDNAYSYYGGRGVSVCERWAQSFESFLSDVGYRPSPKHSIERIDVNGDYEPNNVRWATRTEQGRNKRSNRLLTLDGQAKTVAEWAGIRSIPAKTIYTRLSRGWSPEDALATNRANKAIVFEKDEPQ